MEDDGNDYEGAILSGYFAEDPDSRDAKICRAISRHQDHCGKCSNGIDCPALGEVIDAACKLYPLD